MKVNLFFRIAFYGLLIITTVSCSKENGVKDKAKIIKLYVSGETGIDEPWSSMEPQECMLVREERQSDYYPLGFSEIDGFAYEKGYEYTLSVAKTTLANSPADDNRYTYKLIEILIRTSILPPELPQYTEDDIQYKEG